MSVTATGPMGVVRIDEAVTDPYRQTFTERGFWERGDPNPSYYIIPDQANDERYLYAELYGDDPLTPAWLADVAATLRGFDGWGLGLGNIPESYVLILGDRVMVKRPHLSRCKDAESVVTVVRQLLESGKKQGHLDYKRKLPRWSDVQARRRKSCETAPREIRTCGEAEPGSLGVEKRRDGRNECRESSRCSISC
jgi:hypothetical protein